MSDAVVVDASVMAKWLFVEDHSPNARAFLRAIAGERQVVAPPLIRSEITNIVYKKLRAGGPSLVQADHALARFMAFRINLAEPDDLYASALKLAAQYNLGATYDAQYLSLARTLDAEFWTADRELARAVSAHWVRWIGDHPATAAG